MRKKIGIYLVSMMLIILTFSSVRIVNIETSEAALFEDGTPIAHWHFDEGSGTTAYDSSGNNYHITIYGAGWADGVSGSCLDFDHDYALLTNFNRNVYACNVWLKPKVTITKYSGGPGVGNTLVLFYFLINTPLVALGDGTFRYDLLLGDGTSLVDDETINLNQIGPPEPEPRTAVLEQDITSSEWHMITITWNNGLGRYDVYFDGVKKTVVSSAGGHIDLIYCDDFQINDAISNFIGKVDEVSIYSYPLTGNEISALFDEYKKYKPVADANGPYSGNVNEPIEFDGSGSYDPDGTIVSYEWDFRDGESGSGVNPTHTYDTPGTYFVILTVEDDDGLRDDDAALATIVSRPPYKPSTPSGESTLVIDESGTYSTSATDPEGDQVSYRFDWDADGVHDYSSWTSLGASGHTDSMSHSWSSAGTYVVKAQAKDVYDTLSLWSDGKTVVVTIEPNYPPIKPTLSGETNGRVGQSYIYSASTVDPDGDKVEYWFDWDDGQTSGWLGLYNSGDVCEKSHIWDVEGSYSLKVKARDIYGIESEWSDPLSVSMPRNKPYSDRPFLRFLQNFLENPSILYQLLKRVLIL